jgi:hypothetical protein
MGFIGSNNTKVKSKKTHNFSTLNTTKLEKPGLDDVVDEIGDFIEENGTKIALSALGVTLTGVAGYVIVSLIRGCIRDNQQMQQGIAFIQQLAAHLHAVPEEAG